MRLTGYDLRVSIPLNGQDENSTVDNVLGVESHVGPEF